MRVAIVIPSLYSDDVFLNACLYAIYDLKPKADLVLTYRNDGTQGLNKIRTSLFDWAFEDHDCDLALQCSSDFQLFPDILDHVDENAITTFAFLSEKRSMPLQMLKFLISPNMWTGCYCLPRNAWEYFKRTPWFHGWSGQDFAIAGFAEEMRFPIKRVRSPKYRLMRPSEKMVDFVRDLPLHKKILKLGAWF